MKTSLNSSEQFRVRQLGQRIWNPLRRRAALFLIPALTLCTIAALAAPGVGGKKDFKCFSGNAYIGAEIEGALSVNPSDLNMLLQTTTGIYLQILASQPPVRLAALAQEIAAEAPDVAGLVEMYALETAPATATGGPGEFSVIFDYLNLLTNALSASGAHYNVAVISTEADIALPIIDPSTGKLAYGRVIDHEVILYRSDLPPGYLRISNPQSGQFSQFIKIPKLGISVNRGWCSVDVFTRGERFRYICSHLEQETEPDLQMAQAQELLAGPVQTSLPVLLTGDFNADPLGRNGTVTYDLFTDEGFKDAWTTTHPSDPEGGLTWGHDPLLADPTVEFVWRLDLVLYKGGQFHPTQFDVLDPMLDRTKAPLWPSDHATVASSFMLGNPKAVKVSTEAREAR